VSLEQKEEEELSKIATGIGKVFLQNVREREKLRQWKLAHLDPRNASRTPSAAREPAYRLRYESPINACKSSRSRSLQRFGGMYYLRLQGQRVSQAKSKQQAEQTIWKNRMIYKLDRNSAI
jgi:hypothetical protein